MKKILFIIICLIGTSLTLRAQVAQDSTQASDDRPVHALPQSTTQAPQYQDDVLQNPPQENMIQIDAKEVPASLRKALSNPKYAGWEDATIYHDKSENFYSLKLQKGDSIINYRFAKDGKPLE